MARRRIPPEPKQDTINMTPMIDIVFQLIIFFMLVMDMTKAKLENLVLPYASKAIKEEFGDPKLLLMNVMEDGTIKIQGRVYWRPENKDDNQKVEDLFIARRQDPRYQEVQGREDWVNYPLMVRADRSTAFEHVQKILMIATHHGGVTRLQLGAKMPNQ